MPGSHPPTLRGFCYWGAHPLPTHRDQIPTCRDSGLPQKDFEIVSKSYLMDGGFATREDITALEQRSVSVYAPVRLPRNRPEHERYQPRYEDGPEVVRWRQRMATEEAKAIYRQRGSIAEWTNAQVRLHGSIPIQRTRTGQSHHRYASCRRSPQPPALGGVDELSRHSGGARDLEVMSPGRWPQPSPTTVSPQQRNNSVTLANAFSSTNMVLTTKGLQNTHRLSG